MWNVIVLIVVTAGGNVRFSGSTIHSVFSIEVQRGPGAALADLNLDTMQRLRVLFADTRLIIVDEMSMVSNVLLTKISLRLQVMC